MSPRLAVSFFMTRAELMRHALSQTLRRVHDLAGEKFKLDEEAPMARSGTGHGC